MPHGSASRRVTSVLFGDLVGFTHLSETRDQEDVRELLSGYFEQCRLVIDRYGGTVEKFIGDAVMAVWGVPTTHEDDAERAVRAGLEIVTRVAALGVDIGVPDLAMRVGIVTGEVAVTVGAQHQGMVAGDPVNTASRVQSAAAPGQVWVDETTRLLTSSSISYLDVGSHAMKGKAEPMPLWSVQSVVAGLGGGQRADGLEAPHVGRDRELRLVKEVFHGVEESRRPALLLVSGDPGVGKTRLGWEFEKYTDGLHRAVRWHSGRCLAYGEGAAYYALAEAVRGRLNATRVDTDDGDVGAAMADSDVDQAILLARALSEFVGDAEEREWLEPRMGALLGIGALGTFTREDLFNAWTTFFARLSAGDQPVILVIDDAQHADDGLIGFLEHLVTVATFPMFVLVLARQGLLEARPALASNRRVTTLHLDALSDTDMASLVTGLVHGMPESATASLVERSDGIPVFAVETVRSLIDRDLVVPRGGHYVLRDPEGLDLEGIDAPASLQSLLSARLDTLPSEQRVVVDRASVLGTSFSQGVISQLCPEVGNLEGALAALVRLQLLRQESDRLNADFGRYHFVQAGMRQVAYNTLSRRDRKAMHLTAVDVLEEGDNSAGEASPLIAQHLRDAIDALPDSEDFTELTTRMLTHLERAAERSAALGSRGEAATHLTVALSHCVDPARALRIEESLAEQLDRSGQLEAAIEHATHVIVAADERGDLFAAARAVAIKSRAMCNAHAEYEQATALINERLERLSHLERGDEVQRVELLLTENLVAAMLRQGLVDRRATVDHHVVLADQVGDQADVAQSYINLALFHQGFGSRSLARLVLNAAGEIARARHDPLLLARVQINLNADLNADNAIQAVEHGREGAQAAKVCGDVGWVEISVLNLCEGLLFTGDWDEVLTNLDETAMMASNRPYDPAFRAEIADARGLSVDLDTLDDLGPMEEDHGSQALRMLLKARLALLAGSPDGGLLVRAVARALLASGVADDFTLTWRTAAELAWRSGHVEVVEQLLEIVEQERTIRHPVGLRAECARMRGLVALTHGDATAVEEHLTSAISLGNLWGAAPMVAQCRADLGSWLIDQGRREEGEAQVALARATFDQLGAKAWSAQLDARLAGAAVLGS